MSIRHSAAPIEVNDPLRRPRPTVFIAYARQDLAFVRELALNLESAEVSVLMAVATAVTPGEEWQAGLLKTLGDADGVLVVISVASSGSQELLAVSGVALGIFQEQGRPLVIPIIIDDHAEVPAPLAHVKTIVEPSRNVSTIAAQITNSLSAQTGRLEVREQLKRESQEHLEEFLRPVLNELHDRERSFRKNAKMCYFFTGSTLITGFAFAIYRAVFISMNRNPTWPQLVQNNVSTLVVFALLTAIARFAYILGKSFMVESLRNNNRLHAISLGKFYLEAFGERAQWTEMKEAFRSWNIDIGSSFLTQNATDIDPQLMQTAVAIATALAAKAKASAE
jgi:hypothetical protein